jgi:hypothetical protein
MGVGSPRRLTTVLGADAGEGATDAVQLIAEVLVDNNLDWAYTPIEKRQKRFRG